MSKIEKGVFEWCSALEEISVAPESTHYAVKGNCLIELATKTLLKGFDNSVIPADGSVTVIAEQAFYGCKKITEIVVPDGVTTIGQYAFAHCTALQTIVLPASLLSIERDVHINIYGIDVFYKGTQTEWDAVEKNGTFASTRFNIYFLSEEQPVDSGNYWHYVNNAITKW